MRRAELARGANLEETTAERVMEPLELRDIPRMVEKTPPALRVLVVDDEPLIRWSVAQTLTDCGYEVVETGDACGARSAVGSDGGQFDVVLLDYRLPDSDDLGLLAAIRRQSPDAQVILMTAFGKPEVVRGALELGAYRVVNKPFEMQAIADLVAQAHLAGSRHENH
jgi:DNA-binding NtrC family response regulator